MRWLVIPIVLLAATPAHARYFAGGAASAPVSTCPDDDGSSGATVGAANQPALLNGYAAAINGPHGLGCKVAGVDYRVGLVVSPSLADPTAGGLPSGVSYNSGSHTVTISSNNVTFQAWDLTVAGGLELVVNSGVTGTHILGNKFLVQSPNCLGPMVFQQLAGTTTVQYNTIDGGGAACASLSGSRSSDVDIVSAASGATFIYQWNLHQNIGEDAVNYTGPGSGTPLAIFHRYNMDYIQGWRGHPDGVQFVNGLYASPIYSHNTYYNPIFAGQQQGTQPAHIEAQLTATITNGVVSYSTFVTTGSCNGGVNYPVGCSVNFDIACKQDAGSNSNTGFAAYGNYIDRSGAIAALTNAYNCVSTTWGSPHPNWDAVAGTQLSTNP